MKFKGDIIITDPCYIIKKYKDDKRPDIYTNKILKNLGSVPFTKYTTEQMEEYKKLEKLQEKWDLEHPDDWEVCGYGDNMEKLGITTYLTSSTEYGDWSCTTYEEGTKKKLGNFCADAGLVSVFLLEEVLKYNPDFHTGLYALVAWFFFNYFADNTLLPIVHQSGFVDFKFCFHNFFLAKLKQHHTRVKRIGKFIFNEQVSVLFTLSQILHTFVAK